MIMKKILPVFIWVALCLTSCLPAVFIAGATAGGVVVAERRTFDTIVKDKKIAYDALIQLNSEPDLKDNAHISVATFNHVVLLVGEAPSLELRRRAYELVKVVPNIKRINNEIQVCPPLTEKERSLDTWVTTKVKAAMLAEKGLNSTQIKVITEDGAVYLMGLVTHQQAGIAINVARQVTGVTKVVTLFEFTN
jgi:osmotically-inducible protein OsmY